MRRVQGRDARTPGHQSERTLGVAKEGRHFTDNARSLAQHGFLRRNAGFAISQIGLRDRQDHQGKCSCQNQSAQFPHNGARTWLAALARLFLIRRRHHLGPSPGSASTE